MWFFRTQYINKLVKKYNLKNTMDKVEIEDT